MYNWALEQWKQWVEDKKNGIKDDNPNWIKLSSLWTAQRPEWAKSITRTAVTYAIKSVNQSFVNHFKIGLGWPKFKKRGACKDSFHLGCDKCFLRPDKRHIKIPLIKEDIKMAEALRFNGKILSYTVSTYGGRWYVSIQMDVADTRSAPDSICGVDVGMKHPAVCSDGRLLTLPENRLKELDKRLRRSQRRLSRTQRNSKRRAKAVRRKQRLQAKINHIRWDCIHKFTSSVCKNHATVVIESLEAREMHQGSKYIRAGMSKSCMYEILRQLRYKAMCLVEADKWYPSSQLCSQCGSRHKMPLTTRVYICPECGVIIDRDLNAAINLSKYPGSQG